MSSAHVLVPQGVGDIVWAYQKLKPLFDTIDFDVVDLGGMPTSMIRRAERLISGLPGVGRLTYEKLSEYPAELREKVHLPDLLDRLRRGDRVPYSVNPWLEAGVPMEDIDPGVPVLWDWAPPPKCPDWLTHTGPYLLLYVSGDTARHVHFGETIWPPEQWLNLVRRVFKVNHWSQDAVAVVLVGAAFDHAVTAYLCAELVRTGFGASAHYDLELPELLHVTGKAALFLGYQSGLNVIADAAGAIQTMVYFPSVLPMGASWVNPKHRDGRFRFTSFAAPTEEVAKLCTVHRA